MWDGDMTADHTMQDEWRLASENGWAQWTTDPDGQMVAACYLCGEPLDDDSYPVHRDCEGQ